MIYTEAKKLHLIEFLIREKNEEVLKKVEQILTESTHQPGAKFAGFVNHLSEDELKEFEKNIEDAFEHINETDWK